MGYKSLEIKPSMYPRHITWSDNDGKAFYSWPLHSHIVWMYVLSEGWMWADILSSICRPVSSFPFVLHESTGTFLHVHFYVLFVRRGAVLFCSPDRVHTYKLPGIITVWSVGLGAASPERSGVKGLPQGHLSGCNGEGQVLLIDSSHPNLSC